MAVGFGKKIRASENAAKKKASKSYKCPSCSRVDVNRVSSGVWQCKKCRKKFASGAFEFKQ